MSKYAINKIMNLVNSDPEALARYRDDPAGFTRDWDRAQPLLRLSDEARRALSERDHVALYALGAHPHLLWSFASAIWQDEVPLADLSRDFKAQTREIGHPDFAT